jgi:hypothetical protein
MATRSMAQQLPPELRTELEQRLLEQGFSGYDALRDWLAERGYEFGVSSVKRFGKRFEERCEMLRLSTQQAELMRQHFGDDEAALAEAALQMAQSTMFNLMLERGEELNPKEISMISRALAESTRGTVQIKKYQEEVKKKAEAKFAELEGEAGKGIDPETLARVRSEIYGLF